MNVGGVALGAIRDEDLVGVDRGSLLAVVPRYRVQQEVVPLLGTISPEGLLVCQLLGRGLQGLDDRRPERQHDVANSQPNDLRRGVLGGERPDPFSDLREEISRL